MEDQFKQTIHEAPAAPDLVFGAPEENREGQELTVAAGETVPGETADSGKEAATPDMEASLTPEERKQVDAFAEQIDVTNTAAILNYGVGTQKKLADFSQKTIDNVRTSDVGEVGEMLTGLVTQLKSFDIEENEKGLRALFRKQVNKAEALKAKYSKVETNVTAVQTELEKHQVQLLKDVDVLDRMYDLNLGYFKELTMYIAAGKKKLSEIREGQLRELEAKAQQSGLAEDAQAARDIAAQCTRFEKKLYDLELTRTIAMQTAPQIRMVQASDTEMAEKIQSTIVNTIPLWKNQMVIAIGLEHSTRAARAEREVNDMTNQLLMKNADTLKTAATASAKESERGIVDIETLKHTNETLISAMDEILQIQTEGKQKRQEAEGELANIEAQLKDKLLEAARR